MNPSSREAAAIHRRATELSTRCAQRRAELEKLSAENRALREQVEKKRTEMVATEMTEPASLRTEIVGFRSEVETMQREEKLLSPLLAALGIDGAHPL
jgi:chromosome segregation ATPase